MKHDHQFDMQSEPFEANMGYNPAFLRRVRTRRLEREASCVPRFRIDAPIPPWAKMIVADCCRKHGLDPETALAKSRKRKIVICRREIFWRIRQHPRAPSLPRIGQWFGLDHTSVLNAIRKYKAA